MRWRRWKNSATETGVTGLMGREGRKAVDGRFGVAQLDTGWTRYLGGVSRVILIEAGDVVSGADAMTSGCGARRLCHDTEAATGLGAGASRRAGADAESRAASWSWLERGGDTRGRAGRGRGRGAADGRRRQRPVGRGGHPVGKDRLSARVTPGARPAEEGRGEDKREPSALLPFDFHLSPPLLFFLFASSLLSTHVFPVRRSHLPSPRRRLKRQRRRRSQAPHYLGLIAPRPPQFKNRPRRTQRSTGRAVVER